MTIKTVRIHDTLYIFDNTTELGIREMIVADGHSAEFGNGTTEYIVDEVIVDATKEGSAMFQWDKSNKRVKHNRVRCVRGVDGNVTRTVERTVYKVME